MKICNRFLHESYLSKRFPLRNRVLNHDRVHGSGLNIEHLLEFVRNVTFFKATRSIQHHRNHNILYFITSTEHHQVSLQVWRHHFKHGGCGDIFWRVEREIKSCIPVSELQDSREADGLDDVIVVGGDECVGVLVGRDVTDAVLDRGEGSSEHAVQLVSALVEGRRSTQERK